MIQRMNIVSPIVMVSNIEYNVVKLGNKKWVIEPNKYPNPPMITKVPMIFGK